MQIPYLVFAVLFLAALFAGWIDAVVGGGGLVQLPALLLVPGLTPVEALATNKFGSIFGTAASSLTYYRAIRPSPKFFLPMAFVALLSSYGGAILAASIPGNIFLPIILVILVGVLIFTLFKPTMGTIEKPSPSPLHSVLYSLLIGLIIGFYDGLIGPGTGTFLIMSLVLLAGYNFVQASANAKIVNFATNLGALLYFLPYGAVKFEYGIALAAGNMLGGFLGAHTAIRKGNRFVRFMLISVVSVLILKISFDIWS